MNNKGKRKKSFIVYGYAHYATNAKHFDYWVSRLYKPKKYAEEDYGTAHVKKVKMTIEEI